MWRRYLVFCCCAACHVCVTQSLSAQSVPAAQVQKSPQKGVTAAPAKDPSQLPLVRVETVQAPAEMASTFSPFLKCDNEGNLYLQTDPSFPAIHKLNPKGERVAVFQATSNPDRKIDFSRSFSIAPSGELYELVYPHEITRYVFVYKSDGTLDSTIKLQPGFAWSPAVIAVFPSGQLLISGLEYDRDVKAAMWPFTGIFAQDGRLLKEIDLEDDGTLRDMAASGDDRVILPNNSHGNRAISYSKAEIGSDGNAYMMRWTNPAIFYAISPGGEVVRRFKIAPPADSAEPPMDMHISGDHIAVMFVNRQTMHKVIKVVDLKGHELASYVEPMAGGKPTGDMESAAFACYTQNPDRFTFLGAGDDSELQLWVGGVR